MASNVSTERVGALALFLTLFLYFASSKDGGDTSLSLSGADGRPFPGHVLVTGGAGFIGSHATMRLMDEGYAVTIVDNYSRGNPGAIAALRKMAPRGKLRVVEGDLGVREDVERAFVKYPVDVVIHFAAIAYVGESMADPNRYYHNITSNTVIVLETMQKFGVKRLVYSSTCATYGNPDVLPITEKTPTVPINPYGKAKLYAETAIRDYAASDPSFRAAILRYFNVFGSDPEGRLGEFPRPELRHHGRISGACFDAALGLIPELVVMGTDFPTRDGTCVRDFIHVTDLVDAHLAVVGHVANPPVLYNVGTGKGVSVREFVEGCKRVTGAPIKVREQRESRPGDYAEVYADVTKIGRSWGGPRGTRTWRRAWATPGRGERRTKTGIDETQRCSLEKCINRDIFPHNSSLYILPVSRREIDGAGSSSPRSTQTLRPVTTAILLVARSLRVAAP